MSIRTPSYRLHRATGQAVVTIQGRDYYLGQHGTEASKLEYERLIKERWSAPLPSRARGPGNAAEADDLTVSELILAYLQHADGYYRKNGQPTTEPVNIRLAMRPLRQLYGPTIAREFGPRALKAVRQAMLEGDLCRTEINKRVRHVVRAFRWAVENELVPPSVHHGLKAVPGLKRGRSEARESEPVKPVPEAHVDAVRPYVAPQVWAMIELQRITGMRAGEVCQMRTCDIDVTGQVWVFKPQTHKTEHHGRERLVYLGPRAQEILRSWLKTDLAAYLFSPREAMEERWTRRREGRKSPLTPSQRARSRKAKPRKTPRDRYDTDSYRRSIKYACKRAGVPDWHPHQLRHNAATWLRKEHGLEVARLILGHASAAVTEVYAELDHERARTIMARVG